MQALWVLGSAATLQRSPVWAALLEDADKRAKIVRDAFARCAVRSAAVMMVCNLYAGKGIMLSPPELDKTTSYIELCAPPFQGLIKTGQRVGNSFYC